MDTWVLGKVERFAHFIQRATGIAPLRIAMWGEVITGSSFLGCWMIPSMSVENKMIAAVAATLIIWSTFKIFPYLDEKAKKNAAAGLSNEFKVHPIYKALRIVSLVLLFLAATALYFLHPHKLSHVNFFALALGNFMGLYFLACDELPPGVSRKPVLASLQSK